MKKNSIILMTLLLSACSTGTPLQFFQGLFGYIPPPDETSIAQELRSEFERCERVNPNRHCAQIAYDIVRKVKGLEPRTVPKGVVIILEGDVDVESEEYKKNLLNNETQPQDENKQ